MKKYNDYKQYFIEIYEEKFGSGIEELRNYVEFDSIVEHLDNLQNRILHIQELKEFSECLIHGDLNYSNLLWQDGSVSIIDWELSRFSVPEIEFGGLLYCYSNNLKDFRKFISFFKENIYEIVTAFYLRLLDVLVWRIKLINVLELGTAERERQSSYLNRDIEKLEFFNKDVNVGKFSLDKVIA